MIYIGIDAGKKTGIAIWDTESREILAVKTLDFFKTLIFVGDSFDTDAAKIIVEDPNKIKPIHGAKKNVSIRPLLKIAQNVGGVKRETELLIEGLEAMGFDVEGTKPRKTKKDAAYIKSICGFEGSTNEHTRDAIMLVVGR